MLPGQPAPSPQDVLGFEPGSRPARHDELLRYFEALAAATGARLVEYGRSHEDRRLVHLTIGAPDGLGVWVGCGIHGDETTGGDAALTLAHRLATGIEGVTDRLLVHIDPAQNPDGRARHLARATALAGRVPSLDPDDAAEAGLWPSGRGNHYLFDLNRDLVAQSQPESRARTAAMLAVRPQVVLELHEMEADDTFLYGSPAEPLNPYLPPHLRRWWDRLGAAHGAALDARGRPFYTGEWNEVFFPGYADIWPAYTGAVPVIFEQAFAGVGGVRTPNGGTVTYADAVAVQLAGLTANLEAAAAGADELRADWRAVATEDPSGDDYLVSGGAARVAWLADALRAQGLAVRIGPAGELAMPATRLASALLETHVPLPGATLERERRALERGAETGLYDITAWSLPLACGLAVTRGGRAKDADRGAPHAGGLREEAAHGYLFEDDLRVLAPRLLHAGVRLRVAREAFAHDGRDWPAGCLLIRRADNADGIEATIDRLAREQGIDVHGAAGARSERGPDLGGRRFKLLHASRIGVLGGEGIDEPAYGALWHALDVEAGYPMSTLVAARLRQLDPARYDVVVLPGCDDGADHAALLGASGVTWLRDWVRSGGTLVAASGDAAAFAAAEELARVRSRAQATADRPQTMFAAAPAAAFLVADGTPNEPAQAPVPPVGPDGFDVGGPQVELSAEQAEALDAYLRRFMPSGAFLAASLDTHHWLAAGLEPHLPVLVRAGDALIAGPGTEVVGRFAPLAELHVAGLLWPEAALRLRDTAYLTRNRLGRGQVIAFASPPAFRGSSPGSQRLLMNAVFVAPAFVR